MPKQITWVLKSEFAKIVGVGPSNVTRWIKEGKLKGCINSDGKINRDKAVKQVNFLLNPHHQRNPDGNKGKPKRPKNIPTEEDFEQAESKSGISGYTSVAEAQRVKLVYEAMLKKIEFEIKKGKLIEAEAIIRENFAIGQALREGLESISERCAALVAVEPDQHQCREILYREHNQLLTDICERLNLIAG
jgi:hypothetical protein